MARRSIDILDLGSTDQQLRCVVPQPLQLIEGSGLGVKEVDDEIHEVEQNPAATGQTLDVVCVMTATVQLFHDRLSDTAHVSVRGPRRDHEEIGGIIQAAKVEHNQMISLQILYRIQRQSQRF